MRRRRAGRARRADVVRRAQDLGPVQADLEAVKSVWSGYERRMAMYERAQSAHS